MMGNLLAVESSRQWEVKTSQYGPRSCFLNLKNNNNVNFSLNAYMNTCNLVNEISKIIHDCTSQKCP